MSLDEFYDLMCAIGASSDSFGLREIGIQFNLAKATQINELERPPKHMQMSILEFIEAMARVADKLSKEYLLKYVSEVN